ncbi:MAG: hypothetical protein MJE68_27000, partial [Proteobacteria bacterium]|nr:hypothetical protein [Pseudomonadota bacterium]
MLLFAPSSFEELTAGEDHKHHGVGDCQRLHDVLLSTQWCCVFLLNQILYVAFLLHFGMCLIEVPVLVNHVGQ